MRLSVCVSQWEHLSIPAFYERCQKYPACIPGSQALWQRMQCNVLSGRLRKTKCLFMYIIYIPVMQWERRGRPRAVLFYRCLCWDSNWRQKPKAQWGSQSAHLPPSPCSPELRDISFLCCLCHLYIRVEVLHRRIPENLLLSHPINWLHALALGSSLIFHIVYDKRPGLPCAVWFSSPGVCCFCTLCYDCPPDPIDQLHLFQDP